MAVAWMRAGCLSATLWAATLWVGTAVGQTMYRGYDIGPDYGRMLQDMQRRNQDLTNRMQQTEAQIVQQTMQNPDCAQKYQMYRAQGGNASYPEFAYRYAATAGFSPQGIQRWNQNEAANRAREQATVMDLRRAEAARGRAQQDMNDRFGSNLREQGRVMGGDSTWVDPTNGARQVMPYLGPQQVFTDPRSGNQYARDERGQYWVRTPNGQVLPMGAGP